ncbi:MAG: hypothetical protein U1B80_06900, partial [Anaerolineaceae bacterium]|nr:hypothetical protein [Anaerolineaceae bacterium]
MSLDNIVVTGCSVPSHPTLTKSFSPNPIAVNGVSTLTFTLTNPNSVALTGVKFTDALPSGVQVAATPAASTTCGGTPTWAPSAAATSLTFGDPTGASIPANGSCTASVNVTATTAGPHANVSGFISSTQSGTNTTSTGYATATLTAIRAPRIVKAFAANPILVGGVSTLTFNITNPNQNESLTGVAFTDAFPTSPGAMVVANPTGAATSGCGSPTFAPSAGAASINFSNGTIAGGDVCTVKVNVTAPNTGSYVNTSGTVSAAIAGNGNTATDTLLVQTVHPGVAILKRVSTSSAGPWTTFVAVNAGAQVYYEFTVENTGDVALTAVNVADPILSGQDVNLSGCAWANMPLYDLKTCGVGPVVAASGSHSNTATAHGTYNSVVYNSTPSTATYAITGLTLAKSVAQSYFTAAGDVLNYSYLVTNSGAAPLLGPVTVSDNKATVTCPAVSTVGDFDAYFDPAEALTCTATYIVQAADVAAGSITNIATATVGGVSSNTDTVTVRMPTPAIQLQKTGTLNLDVVSPNGVANPGDTVSYAFTVTN